MIDICPVDKAGHFQKGGADMSKAVDIFDGILFVRTRHYNDVKKVVVLQGNKPEKRFFEKQRLQGEWIDIALTEWKCSNCNYQVNRWNNTNFCPNCGADMRGEDNG